VSEQALSSNFESVDPASVEKEAEHVVSPVFSSFDTKGALERLKKKRHQLFIRYACWSSLLFAGLMSGGLTSSIVFLVKVRLLSPRAFSLTFAQSLKA